MSGGITLVGGEVGIGTVIGGAVAITGGTAAIAIGAAAILYGSGHYFGWW
jgi:hypothetical protein